MTYQPTATQLDGLVKCGAIESFSEVAVTGGKMLKVWHKFSHIPLEFDVHFTNPQHDIDILTAHLMRELRKKEPTAFVLPVMNGSGDCVGYDVSKKGGCDPYRQDGSDFYSLIGDSILLTELEAVIEAVLAVCEVK